MPAERLPKQNRNVLTRNDEYAKKLRNRATRTASQLLEKAKKMKSMKARITRNQNGDEASQADIAVRDLDEIGASMDTASHTPTHVEVADGTYQTCDNSMQIEDRNVKGSARKVTRKRRRPRTPSPPPNHKPDGTHPPKRTKRDLPKRGAPNNLGGIGGSAPEPTPREDQTTQFVDKNSRGPPQRSESRKVTVLVSPHFSAATEEAPSPDSPSIFQPLIDPPTGLLSAIQSRMMDDTDLRVHMNDEEPTRVDSISGSPSIFQPPVELSTTPEGLLNISSVQFRPLDSLDDDDESDSMDRMSDSPPPGSPPIFRPPVEPSTTPEGLLNLSSVQLRPVDELHDDEEPICVDYISDSPPPGSPPIFRPPVEPSTTPEGLLNLSSVQLRPINGLNDDEEPIGVDYISDSPPPGSPPIFRPPVELSTKPEGLLNLSSVQSRPVDSLNNDNVPNSMDRMSDSPPPASLSIFQPPVEPSTTSEDLLSLSSAQSHPVDSMKDKCEPNSMDRMSDSPPPASPSSFQPPVEPSTTSEDLLSLSSAQYRPVDGLNDDYEPNSMDRMPDSPPPASPSIFQPDEEPTSADHMSDSPPTFQSPVKPSTVPEGLLKLSSIKSHPVDDLNDEKHKEEPTNVDCMSDSPSTFQPLAAPFRSMTPEDMSPAPAENHNMDPPKTNPHGAQPTKLERTPEVPSPSQLPVEHSLLHIMPKNKSVEKPTNVGLLPGSPASQPMVRITEAQRTPAVPEPSCGGSPDPKSTSKSRAPSLTLNKLSSVTDPKSQLVKSIFNTPHRKRRNSSDYENSAAKRKKLSPLLLSESKPKWQSPLLVQRRSRSRLQARKKTLVRVPDRVRYNPIVEQPLPDVTEDVEMELEGPSRSQYSEGEEEKSQGQKESDDSDEDADGAPSEGGDYVEQEDRNDGLDDGNEKGDSDDEEAGESGDEGLAEEDEDEESDEDKDEERNEEDEDEESDEDKDEKRNEEDEDEESDEEYILGNRVNNPPVPTRLLQSETYKTLKKYPEQPCTNAGLARAMEEIAAGQDFHKFQTTHTPGKPTKPQGYFKRRKGSQKTLQSEVRSFAKLLLGEQPWKIPTIAQLTAFEQSPTSKNSPQRSPFRLDLGRRKLFTGWNKLAAKVFAEMFIAEEDAVCKDKARVEAAFLAHLHTLQKHYQKHRELDKSDDDIDGATEVKKRDDRLREAGIQRKFNLLKRRTKGHKAYANDSSIQRMEQEIFPYLTPGVMSGDEEDFSYLPPRGLKCKRFIVRSMTWRNPAAVEFFRVLDALYFSLRCSDDGKWSRGHFPDERLRCERTESGRAVRGLPRNFYNPAWLATLDPLEIEMLDMQPSVNFDFSQDILRIAARFLGVQNRHSKPLSRGHKALESLKGSGPSAQTVANPAQFIRVPDHHSPPTETGEETRDSYHNGLRIGADQPREPPAPQQRFPLQKKDLKKSHVSPSFNALPNANGHQRDPPGTSIHPVANPSPHNVAQYQRDAAAISQHRFPALANAPQSNDFTSSQVPSSHYSPSQQATFYPNAVAGPSGSQVHTAASPNMHIHSYGYQGYHTPYNYFPSQGMSPFNPARHDWVPPSGGIKKPKSKRK